jgi:hypothetical protein
MANRVIGQTGTTVLSDEKIHYKAAQKRTVRYRYERLSDCGVLCTVVGPFHSRTYGACGWGVTKTSAKKALIRTLANEHGYIGHLMFSDVDEADRVGDNRVSRSDDRKPIPITMIEARGSAGQ